MPNSSKYDSFLTELNSFEKEVYTFIHKKEVVDSENLELRKKFSELESENNSLKKKIENLELKLAKINDGKTPTFLAESDNLKERIGELISRIDYHLRS